MKREELRALRMAANLNQTEAAKALGMALGRYQSYERGEREIPEDEAEMARSVLRCMQLPEEAKAEKELVVRRALGEAVLMLTDAQREALYERTRRDLVAEAAAEVAMARINSTLAQELQKTKSDLQEARETIRKIKTAMNLQDARNTIGG